MSMVRFRLWSWINSLLPEHHQRVDHTPCYSHTHRQPIIGDNEQGQCPFPQEGSQVKDKAGHVSQSMAVQLLLCLLQLQGNTIAQYSSHCPLLRTPSTKSVAVMCIGVKGILCIFSAYIMYTYLINCFLDGLSE